MAKEGEEGICRQDRPRMKGYKTVPQMQYRLQSVLLPCSPTFVQSLNFTSQSLNFLTDKTEIE